MNNAEKSRKIMETFTEVYGVNIERESHIYSACMQIARWKDEQLESKLMQIIILAQQGYTSGATDEMILKHCKELINENTEP